MSFVARRGSIDPRRAMVALLIGATLARLCFAATTGLGIDETYMVAIGRHWELSYFDHPPLAWWLSHASALVFGGESALIVRAPFIALSALSAGLMYALGGLLFGRTAGFLAALAMSCAPVLGVTTGSWVLPDGPLDAALLGGALCLAHVLLRPGASPALWLLAGLCAGLAMLSKLHGIFLFAGVGLFLLTSAPHRRWLVSPWPWLGAFVALAVVSPAIVWNAQHGWASIAFQGARAATRVFRPWLPFVALAGQAAFLAPWIWAPLVVAVWRCARAAARDSAAWLLISLGIGPVVLFPLIAAWSDQKPLFHWAAPGYLLLFPLLGRFLAPAFEAGSRRVALWIRGSIAFDLVAMAAVVVLSVFPRLAGSLLPLFPALDDPMAEMTDWSDVAAYVDALPPGEAKPAFVVGRRWYEAAKIDYALHGARDVVCLGDDCRGYDFVRRSNDHAGEDAIVLIPENVASVAMTAVAPRFGAIEPMPPLLVTHGPFVLARLAVFRARSYKPAP